MPNNATMTIELSRDMKDRLDDVAKATRRSIGSLANEAIARFVATETVTLDEIRLAIAEVEAGNTVPHETVMQRVRATISAPRKQLP